MVVLFPHGKMEDIQKNPRFNLLANAFISVAEELMREEEDEQNTQEQSENQNESA